MTPHQYFESFVQGNLCDCENDPGDLRRAFNAAIAASHLADNYYAYKQRHDPEAVTAFPDIGGFVAHLDHETGGAFRDLRSISNAYKHLYITGSRRQADATLLSGGPIESVRVLEAGEGDVETLDVDYEQSPDPLSGREFVRFKRKDGTTGEFLPTLEAFLDYWCREYIWETDES